jgi:hypothetical protein
VTAGALAAADSLEFDVAPLAAAIAPLATSTGPIMQYVAAVRAIPMGEQPIIIGGQRAGAYDVLSKRPELKAALYNAIRRAEGLASYMDTLHNWANGGATQMEGLITPPLETIRTILAAVPAGGTINAADLRRIVEQMQLASVHAWMVSMGMTQIGAGIHDFLSHIIIDHDTLANGPLALGKMAQEIGQQISAEAMPYVLNPMSRGIGETILQIGRTFIAAIDNVSRVIGNARIGHEAMGLAATALATFAATATSKYQAAASAVNASNEATMSVTLRKLQLSMAIASWKQFADFFNRSGL